MPEQDTAQLAEEAPIKFAAFLLEMYKTMQAQKQQEAAQAAQQAGQEALQAKQQAFMTEQNEKLLDAMTQSGYPTTDANVEAGKRGLTRLDRLAKDEVDSINKVGDLDKQIADIDNQQKALLAPKTDPATEISKIDDKLAKLKTQEQLAPQMLEMHEKLLQGQPGMTPEKIKEAVDTQKKSIADSIAKERAELQKAKSDLRPPDDRLADLQKKQDAAAANFKQKSEELMGKQGMNPDEYFESMEKLKAEKEGIDKGIKAEREQIGKEKELAGMTQGQKQEKLQELHGKKADLIKQKGPLQEKLKGIETEKTGLMKSKGLLPDPPKQLSNMEAFKERMGNAEFGYGVKGESKAKAFFAGGFDLVKKSLAKPNSVAATLLKEQEAMGKGVDGPKMDVALKKGPKMK